MTSSLSIFSGGAVKTAMLEIIPGFEATTGYKVAIEFAPMGPLLSKLEAGARPDVVMVADEAAEVATAKGWIDASTKVELGRVGIGVAVNEKAPVPDISTPDAFRAALLAARSIIIVNPKTGTSGKYLAELFEQLGIASELSSKLSFLDGGFVVEPVGRGEIELGIHQITEILPVKGVKLVGALPGELQKVTIYTGAAMKGAPDPDGAHLFLSYIRSREVQQKLASLGFMTAG